MKHQDPMDGWLRGMFSDEFTDLNDLEFTNNIIKRLNRQALVRNLILISAFVIGALVTLSVFAELESLFAPWIALADAKLQTIDISTFASGTLELSYSPFMLLFVLLVPWWFFSLNEN